MELRSLKDPVSPDWVQTSVYFSEESGQSINQTVANLAHVAQLSRSDGKPRSFDIDAMEGEGGEVERRTVLVKPSFGKYLKFDGFGARWEIRYPYDPDETWHHAKIIWSGMPFYTRPMEKVISPAMDWLAFIGADVTKTLVSRVDVCVDLLGVPVEYFREAKRNRRFVPNRLKGQENDQAEEAQSVYQGRHPCYWRFYDKLAELYAENDRHRIAAFLERTGAVEPVTRVELQVSTDKLKDLEYNLRDLNGVRTGWPFLGRWGSKEYLRMVSKKRAGGQSKEEVDPVWQRVQNAFDNAESWVSGEKVEPALMDVGQAMGNSVASLATLAAEIGSDHPLGIAPTFEETIEKHKELLLSEPKWKERFDQAVAVRSLKIEHRKGRADPK